jgi:8-oxo-dGTP diphosphatase
MPDARRPVRVTDIDWQSWTPHERGTVLFVLQGDRVLLIRKKRGLGAGKINGPGGRVEPDETPLQAAVREVEEELGIVPAGVEAWGELAFQFTDGYALLVYVFTARAFTGEPRETDEALPLWTPLAALPFDEMWADDRHWFPLLLARTPFRGRFIFDGDRLLAHDLTPLAAPGAARRPAPPLPT